MRRKLMGGVASVIVLMGVCLLGCGSFGNVDVESTQIVTEVEWEMEKQVGEGEEVVVESPMYEVNVGELDVIDDRYRTYYEVFLYSYYDGNGDGIGDIKGLIEKLDYINDGDDETTSDLGFNGIWLMPVMPSTTYHKYDVTDYLDIDSEYGTLEEFRELIWECKKRGIHVIIDLVMNHSSSQHEWFLTACEYLRGLAGKEPSEEECPYFGYYNFSQGQETEFYYGVQGTDWYYEGKFWSEMPDLNLANEALRKEFEEIIAFWLDLGVDGFRLDASKEYYSDMTASNVEVLTWFNDMVKAQKEDAYIVAEVWTDVGTYAKYYESGIDSLFNFAFANSDGLIASVVKGTGSYSAKSYGEAVASLKERFGQYNENYIDAPFYSNHDMGRSAGYYSGDDSEAQTKISAGMNLLMSGAAFVYYGEELGMKGSGIDENKRAPMYWLGDVSAKGMCDGPKDMENVKIKYGSLLEQENDSYSIYNYYKQAVYLRNRYPEIARGTVTFVEELSDDNVCVFIKEYEGSKIVLVFNICDKEMSIDLKDADSLSDKELQIGGILLTGSETVSLSDNTLTLPAYAITILK